LVAVLVEQEPKMAFWERQVLMVPDLGEEEEEAKLHLHQVMAVLEGAEALE
jgi:hypothetical protein